MGLRDDLLERIAVELHDQEGDIIEGNYAVAAEFVLDAVLDTLADRADEWADHLEDSTWHLPRDIRALVAVLRGDT